MTTISATEPTSWYAVPHKHHYYWSLESGENSTAEKLKDELIDLDEDMEALKEKFEYLSTKKDK